MTSFELLSTVAIVIGVTVFLSLKSKKEKASSWQGELIKKKDLTDEDNENHVYRLIIKTDQGKKKKVTVSEEMFNQAKKGDKYEKAKGEYLPKKLP